MKLKFNIEQIALFPPDAEKAIKLLSDMGLSEWAKDTVIAHGEVFGQEEARSVGSLAFNYQGLTKANELEVLAYSDGSNWMQQHHCSVSHLGMHVTEDELAEWFNFFAEREIDVAQELFTDAHSNPVIANKRWYHYVIFNTRPILGVDVKFIVRHDQPQ